MNEDELTEKYLKEPVKCPFCESTEIYAFNKIFDSLTPTQDVHCRNCKKTWTDVFGLVDVTFNLSK